MANTLQLKNDIKKIKTALASKGLSATFKNKLKVKLQKAENDLKNANPKSAKATLTSLKEQIKKRGYGVYKGAGVDLQKDAKEPALASGYRVSKGLKGNQYSDKKHSKGHVYYEYRANRLDVKQPSKTARYPKLAEGGENFDFIKSAIESASRDKISKNPNSQVYYSTINNEFTYYIGNDDKIIKVDSMTGERYPIGELKHYMAEGGVTENAKKEWGRMSIKERMGFLKKQYQDKLENDNLLLKRLEGESKKDWDELAVKIQMEFERSLGMMAKGGLTEKDKLGLNILKALSGFNDGQTLNGILELLGYSKYRFGKYATENQVNEVKKELESLIKLGYVEESGLGFKQTSYGRKYLDAFDYGSYAEGGVTKKFIDVGDIVKVVKKGHPADGKNYRFDHWDEASGMGGFMGYLVGGNYEGMQHIYDVQRKDLELIKKRDTKMAEGGVTEKEVVDSNAEMVLSQIKAVKHHADELAHIVTKKSDIEAWVVAKIERASTDLSDITHYLDGQHQMMSMGGSVYNHVHKMDKK